MTKENANSPTQDAGACHPKELAETIRENMKPQLVELNKGDLEKVPVLIVPNEMQVVSVKKYLEENRLVPERRSGTVTLDRIPSFLALVERFKSEASTVLFASCKVSDTSIDAKITAVFDYHVAGDMEVLPSAAA